MQNRILSPLCRKDVSQHCEVHFGCVSLWDTLFFVGEKFMKNKLLNVLCVILSIIPLFLVIALITYLSQKNKKTKIEIRNQLLKIYFSIFETFAVILFLVSIISGQGVFTIIISLIALAIFTPLTIVFFKKGKNNISVKEKTIDIVIIKSPFES